MSPQKATRAVICRPATVGLKSGDAGRPAAAEVRRDLMAGMVGAAAFRPAILRMGLTRSSTGGIDGQARPLLRGDGRAMLMETLAANPNVMSVEENLAFELAVGASPADTLPSDPLLPAGSSPGDRQWGSHVLNLPGA